MWFAAKCPTAYSGKVVWLRCNVERTSAFPHLRFAICCAASSMTVGKPRAKATPLTRLINYLEAGWMCWPKTGGPGMLGGLRTFQAGCEMRLRHVHEETVRSKATSGARRTNDNKPDGDGITSDDETSEHKDEHHEDTNTEIVPKSPPCEAGNNEENLLDM